MTKPEGERAVKALQKAFLSYLEGNPYLSHLDPIEFNTLRKAVFRTTFDAFRLGIIGFNYQAREAMALYQHFFGFYLHHPVIQKLPRDIAEEIVEENFYRVLQAFRIGAMVRRDAVQ